MEDRVKMVQAMEFIMRQVNDEEVFMPWLELGVADGDIEYGDFSSPLDDDYYTEDKNFAELMGLFLKCMARARKSGGLYCGGVVSTD